MRKHAYLIIAHHQFLLLCQLIHAIDDERNDIYIHIDKKAKRVPFNRIKSAAKKSNVYFTRRININWGGYSQIRSELILLDMATKHGHYAYYHLLSGSDLPLKSQDVIHAFFCRNAGKEFIQFQKPKISDIKAKRVQYYFPLQDFVGNNKLKLLRYTQTILVRLQKLFGVDRTRKYPGITFQMGSNWFSITDQFARYVLLKKDAIKIIFRNTQCCDELLVQTIFINSPFRDNLFDRSFSDSQIANGRFIIWVNGAPRDLHVKDLKNLQNTDCLFGRKFNPITDQKIIDIVSSWSA